MNYGFVTIKVKNMEESLKFYIDLLGLKEATSFSPQPGVKIVFVTDEKGNKIELIENSHMSISEDAGYKSLLSIGFPVESVDETLKAVNEKGFEVVSGPVQLPSGIKFLYIKDPNGVEIEFIENFKM